MYYNQNTTNIFCFRTWHSGHRPALMVSVFDLCVLSTTEHHAVRQLASRNHRTLFKQPNGGEKYIRIQAWEYRDPWSAVRLLVPRGGRAFGVHTWGRTLSASEEDQRWLVAGSKDRGGCEGETHIRAGHVCHRAARQHVPALAAQHPIRMRQF